VVFSNGAMLEISFNIQTHTRDQRISEIIYLKGVPKCA